MTREEICDTYILRARNAMLYYQVMLRDQVFQFITWLCNGLSSLALKSCEPELKPGQVYVIEDK